MSALLGLLFAVSSTAAQPQHPGSSAADTIVVEGRRTKETANEYIDKLLPALGTEAQFGRFEDPLCPKAIGLTDDLAAQVADRVRQVARAANIRVAAGSCTPNLLIIAAADKKAMIETLQRAAPATSTALAPTSSNASAIPPDPMLPGR